MNRNKYIYKTLIFKLIKNVNLASQNLQKLFNEFTKATIDELWDSEEEIESFF